LFEFVDYGTAGLIKDQIETTIYNFEPRVDSVSVDVNPLPDLNEFDITITYNIIGQELPTQEYSFILEAAR
jgi:predicted component of type VI protein secretion system